MRDWIAFWDSEHCIYVNGRHLDVHYRNIADFIARYVPSPSATVLDFGCGEALHADRVAAEAARLILVEAAPKVRTGLADRFRAQRNIEVRSPQEIAEMPDRSLDLVIMISVAQYVSSSQFSALLVLFRRLLRPGGLLVIGDVIPPHVSPLTDALALLKFGATSGFLWAAIKGLLRTAASDYRKLRSTVGLSLYSEAEMLQKLDAAGFTAARSRDNVGPNPARMTFTARPA